MKLIKTETHTGKECGFSCLHKHFYYENGVEGIDPITEKINTMKCNLIGKPGTLLCSAWCKDCDGYHPQWKYPCVCDNGKVSIEPLGYKLCDKCNGRGYLNEQMD